MTKFLMIIGASAAMIGRAAELDCQFKSLVRCPCPASSSFDCGSAGQGFVDDNEKPTSITLAVYDKATARKSLITLNAPPSEIRNLTTGLERDPWVTAQLRAKNVRLDANSQIDLISAKLPESANLYADADKKAIARKGSTANARYSCFYTMKPSIVESVGCPAKICSSYARCYDRGTPIGERPLACKMTGGSCLPANECAIEESTQVRVAHDVRVEANADDQRSKAAK